MFLIPETEGSRFRSGIKFWIESLYLFIYIKESFRFPLKTNQVTVYVSVSSFGFAVSEFSWPS